MQRQHSNQYTNIYFYVEKLWDQFFLLFSCDRRKFNLTSGFLIFLFMVTGRGIFICSAVSVAFIGFGTHGKKYSRMDQVKFVEDSQPLKEFATPLLPARFHLPFTSWLPCTSSQAASQRQHVRPVVYRNEPKWSFPHTMLKHLRLSDIFWVWSSVSCDQKLHFMTSSCLQLALQKTRYLDARPSSHFIRFIIYMPRQIRKSKTLLST